MKKVLFILMGVVLIGFVTLHFVRRADVFVHKGQLIEGLTRDVGNFYGEHHRLPESWEEFASWSKARGDLETWDSPNFQSRFALQWGATVNPQDPRVRKLFIVLDRDDYADIEDAVNFRLRDRCLTSISLSQSHVPSP